MGMGLQLCTLGSGSSGNCIFLSNGQTSILIDQGLSLSRVERELNVLGVAPAAVSVLITHTHSDHVSGLKSLLKKYGVTAYCAYESLPALRALCGENVDIKPFACDFYVGSLTVSPFAVSHDVPCVGYSVYSDGLKACVATDLGCVSERVLSELKDSDMVLLESNHDEDMLRGNRRYPVYLKRRILSATGHLSNSSCADAVTACVNGGVKSIVLGHLSKENNYPELAFDTVSKRLHAAGVVEGRDVRVEVALPDRRSAVVTV